MTKVSKLSIRRRTPFMASVLCAAVALALPALAQAAPQSDSSTARAMQDTGYALVQLQGEPLAAYVKTKPARGKKVDFGNTTTKSYRAQLSALRNDYKAWLRANVPKATVSGEFDLSLNAVSVKLNGATLAQVSATPMVSAAQYQGLYYPTAADPDLAVIKATDAWAAAGGSAQAGEGVKVAIVDSGIDTGHPCFSDAGYPAQTQLGDRRFTNNKVIAARVFNNKSPSRHYTAEGVGAHGTHVSGTVACNFETPVAVDGVTLPYKMSGVAPRALVGNYNVFPADVENARSEDILNALEAAYADGFDVANMSLGGGASGIQDLLTIAVDNLDRANMVVAISNGNEGPGYGTVGSPGSAARGLTAGASAVGHQIGHKVTVGGAQYAAVKGDFGPGPVTAPLRVVADPAGFNGLSLACAPFTPGSLSGTIALISRNVCDFTVKMRNVQDAGGVGAIVVNRVPGTFVMGQNGEPGQPTIPGFMVDPADLAALKAADGQPTTLPKLGEYQFAAGDNDVIADFTSWGPTDVDFRVKPDVMAPGVNIVSSIPRAYCGSGATSCFAFFNGTSMAAPHLAGSAAVVRQQHPDWSAADVRSAIVNTADRGVIQSLDKTAIVKSANQVGTGRENLLSAVQAAVALDPVSVSFGPVPSGSGQTLQVPVTLTNTSGGAKTYTLAVVESAGSGASFTVGGAPVTLGAGENASVTVSVALQKGAAAGHKQAVLQVSAGGGVVANAMLYTFVK